MTHNSQTRSVVCNVCGTAEAKPLFSAIDRLHGFEGMFQYVQCKQCHLVYMNPQILPEYLPGFYPADYAPHKATPPQTDSKGAKLSMPKWLLDALNSQSKVLDVGCGSGGFLNQLRLLRQCRIFGVDFSENAVHSAKQKYNLNLICGQIFDVPFENNTFDLITAWSCIEHMDDPASAVHKIWALCKPMGTFFLRTPNFDSLAARWFKDKWYHLDCPRHLHLFSPATIKSLLEKLGFQDIRVNHEASSKGWLGSLQYVVYGDNYRPQVKNKIRRSALAKAFVSPISHVAAILKQADTMMITARKPKR